MIYVTTNYESLTLNSSALAHLLMELSKIRTIPVGVFSKV